MISVKKEIENERKRGEEIQREREGEKRERIKW